MKWICNKCKGSNIEVKAWIDANSKEVFDFCGEGFEDSWCRDCMKHVDFDLVEDEDKTQLKLDL
jgi:hypothetical protein